MKRLFGVALWSVVMLVSSQAFALATSASDGVLVTHVWVHPAALEDPVTTASLSIENTGDQPVTLTGASSVAARELVLQDAASAPLDVITIAAGDTVMLSPDGVHLLLNGLLRDLLPDDAISLTLDFAYDDGTPFSVLVGALVQNEAPAPSAILVYDAWARPTALDAASTVTPSSVISGAYGTLENRGTETVRLIRVSSTHIGMIEMHETRIENAIARMRPVEYIEIAPGERVQFAAGGAHLMLMDLQAHLIPGEAAALTFHFDSGDVVTVAVPVIDETTGADSHAHHS